MIAKERFYVKIIKCSHVPVFLVPRENSIIGLTNAKIFKIECKVNYYKREVEPMNELGKRVSEMCAFGSMMTAALDSSL